MTPGRLRFGRGASHRRKLGVNVPNNDDPTGTSTMECHAACPEAAPRLHILAVMSQPR